MNQDQLEQHNKKLFRKAEIEKLQPITYAELEETFNKWLIIVDPGILKFICALYCANKLPGKAVWAIIVGASGSGKTEFLNALLDLPDIEPISTLTPNTFLSGMPGRGDASLLPKLNNKIMLFKDWTSVLSMQKDAKAEIFGQFREIYDGSMKKVFGNGKTRTWEGKVSVLAASTQAVDLNQQQYTHLGERFLNYRLITPDRKTVAMKSLDNEPAHEKMENELRNAMYAFFLGINFEDTELYPKLDKEFKEQIVNLANFCTMARSGVIRDFGMKKEVIFVPAAEMPTRITGQLSKIVTGLMMVNGGQFMEKDMEIVYKVALDSIPQTNKMVIIEMAKADGQTTVEIATALGYPTEPIRIYLENLAMLHVCKRERSNGNAYKWTLDPEFADIVRHYEEVQELTEEELKARAEEADIQSYSALDEMFPDEEMI